MASSLTYLIGDATSPVGIGTKLIAHVCNNKGGWGRGFVVSLSKKWNEPEEDYRRGDYKYNLGSCNAIEVEKDIIVVNMVAQDGYVSRDKPKAICYVSLDLCLSWLRGYALSTGATVHMPRIGCGLGGGDWNTIEDLIWNNLCSSEIEVFVYDLTEKDRQCYRKRIF